jgi:transposase
VLERRPASSVVVELVYPKFICNDHGPSDATVVLVAPAVEVPIERGLAGPGMLADTIVRRWQDHQPLTRLEGIYAREGLPLAKSTICTWHEQLAALAHGLVDAMFDDALTSPYLCTDATGVCWSWPRSNARAVISGCWSHPKSTCSTASLKPTTARQSTRF